MTEPQNSENALSDNTASALCYVLTIITGVLFLLLTPYNKNSAIRFHAFQSIFIGVGMLLIDAVLRLAIAGFHLFSLSFVFSLVDLAFLVLWLYMILMTYQGKTIVLPVIGDLARRQR
jgi:uncharacterized membrane protein